MQREENDTLITDNRMLTQKVINDQFGGLECRSSDTPSISNQQEAEGTTIDGDKENWRTRSTNRKRN